MAPRFALNQGLVLAPVSVLIAVLFCACSGDLAPCKGVAIGAKYELQIGGPLDGASGECAAAWGFGMGKGFSAEIVDMAGRDSCQSGVAKLTGDGGWDLEPKYDGLAGGGGLIESNYTISRIDCSASVLLSVGCESNCWSGDPTSCECRLSFIAQGPDTCPAFCGMSMAVAVTRL